jgi:hypothetical protein
VDNLIERLRGRAADPERRVDAQETQFFAQAKNLDLGGLIGMLGDLRPFFDRALDASRAGQVDPDVVAKADEVASAMSTPAEFDRTRVASPSPAEREAAMYADAEERTARDAREAVAKLTPEARAAMGLPEAGWESVMWGGVGLEEDDESSEEPTR